LLRFDFAHLILFMYFVGPCHCCMAHSRIMGGGNGLHIWRVAASKVCCPTWGLGERFTAPYH